MRSSPDSSSAQRRERREAEDAARAVFNDLLNQLQRAVAAVILALQVSDSSFRSSDPLCVDLLRLIRKCLLAGCRRLSGVRAATHDVALLLVLPEFAGVFSSDFDFVAYLCISRAAAALVRRFFADTARTAHYYFDCAIMRDEELHLAFVSSLTALEPADVHPASPTLAQQCLTASLMEPGFSPAAWGRRQAARGSPVLLEAIAKPEPDIPVSDFALVDARLTAADPFQVFKQRPIQRRAGEHRAQEALAGGAPKTGEAAAEACGSHLSADDALELHMRGSGDPFEAQPAGARSAFDQGSGQESDSTWELAQRASMSFSCLDEPYLRDRLSHASSLVLGDMNEDGRVGDVAGAVTQMQPQHFDICDTVAGGDSCSAGPSSRAADLTAPLQDAFGLDVTMCCIGEVQAQQTIGLRDLATLHRSQQQAAERKGKRRCRRSVVLPKRFASGGAKHDGADEFLVLPPQLIRGGALSSVLSAYMIQDMDGSSDEESEEAADAVADLEALWDNSRTDAARRQRPSRSSSMPAGLSAGALSSALPRYPESSNSGSPGSSTAATPRNSTPPASNFGCAGNGLEDNLSDSDSEMSSSVSVVIDGHMASTACPVPFGVHLDWQLKMRPRLPQVAQLSTQKGLCPSCKERLNSSLFSAPRYCHYLGCYFCSECHEKDLRIIPARVAQRWDFEAKKVCRMAAQYLDLQSAQPLVDVTSIKRSKVSSQAVLTEMHDLRQTLTRIQKVLRDTCCDYSDTFGAIAGTQVPAYMAAGHTLYTLQDLIEIHHKGRAYSLLGVFSRLVTMGTEHIQACLQCRAIARFCPICDSSRPIFRVEVGGYHACSTCQATYHRSCFQRAGAECPVCFCLGALGRNPFVVDIRPR